MIDFAALNEAFALKGSPVQPCKTYLKHYGEQVKERFAAGTTPTSELVAERARLSARLHAIDPQDLQRRSQRQDRA